MSQPEEYARKPRGLARDDVIRAALEIIDRDGVEALSMRRLANRLDVFPTTIYWHAGSRAELIAHVSHHVFSQIEVPDHTLLWSDWILELAHNSRAVLALHPNLAADFSSRLNVTVTSLTMADSVLKVLEGAGFADRALLHAYNTVLGTIFGWIAAEFASEPPARDAAGEAWKQAFEQTLVEADANELPTLRRQLPLVSNAVFMLRWSSGRTAPLVESFDYAMRVMVLGLDAQRRQPIREP